MTLLPETINDRLSYLPRAARVDVDLEVEVRVNDDVEDVIALHVKNLSPSGMLADVIGDRPLVEGDILSLVLALEHRRHDITARVARVEGREAAIQFAGLSRVSRLALIGYVAARRAELEATHALDPGGTDSDWTVILSDVDADDKTPVAPAEVPIDIEYRANPLVDAIAPPARSHAALSTWLLIALAMASAVGFAAWRPQGAGGDRAALVVTPAAGAEVAMLPAKPDAPPGGPVAGDTRVGALLAEGRALFASGKWSLPEARSALGRYNAALAIDPANREALDGITAIAEAYVGKAASIAAAGDGRGAAWRCQRALAILAELPASRERDDIAARARRLLGGR